MEEKTKVKYKAEDKPENHQDQIRNMRNTPGPGNMHRRRLDGNRLQKQETGFCMRLCGIQQYQPKRRQEKNRCKSSIQQTFNEG